MPHMAMPSKRRSYFGGQRSVGLTNIRYYCLSTLDKHHHPDISLEEGMKLLEMCTDELKRRLPIDYKGVRFRSCLPFCT